MRHAHHSAPLFQAVNRPLHLRLRLRVQRRRRLIQNQYRCLPHKSPGNRNPLPLPARKPRALFPQPRIISLRQSLNKLMRIRRLGRGNDLLPRSIQLPTRNILRHRLIKNHHLLAHQRHLPAQTLKRHLPNIRSINRNPPLRRIIKP